MGSAITNNSVKNNPYLIANQTGIKTRETQPSLDIKQESPQKLNPENLNKHLSETKDFYTKDAKNFTDVKPEVEQKKNPDTLQNTPAAIEEDDDDYTFTRPAPAFSANVNMKYDTGTVDGTAPREIKDLAHGEMEGKTAYYKSGNVATVIDNACNNPSQLPEENYFDRKQHMAVMKGNDPNNPINYNYIVKSDPDDPDHVTLYGEGTGTYGTGWDGDVYRVEGPDGKVSYKSVIRMNNQKNAIVTGSSSVSGEGVNRQVDCYRLDSMDCLEAYNRDGTFNRDWLE